MAKSTERQRRPRRTAKYRKARIRHFLLTAGPNALTRGWVNRRHHRAGVVVREVEIIAPHWPKAFDGIRIGHISDLHVGDLLGVERALDIVGQLRDAAPDMVCNTGDLVDLHWAGSEPVAKALGAIKAPMGNFFVLGNHDELDSGEDVERMVADAGTTVLHDDVAIVRRGDDVLRVGGIVWARTPARCQQRIDSALGSESVDLLLSHNPKAFDSAAERDVALTLSGHTHGGQIARRNRPNSNLAIFHGHRRNAGIYDIGDARLFVTVGAGALFALRWNVPAEIAILTVRCGASALEDPASAP
ncbi:MAG: metallophosphoesterase family protein [Phycisphaerales bacterium]|nr:metallophosphoesterase family protein [Phycisphaerales bacterium]